MAGHAGGFVIGAVAGAALARDVLNPSRAVGRRVSGALGVAAVLVIAGCAVQARLVRVPIIAADRDAAAAFVHFEAQEYSQAVDRYTRALALGRKRAWLFNRGLAHLNNEEPKLAQEDLEAAHDMEATLETYDALCSVGMQLATTSAAAEKVIGHCTASLALEQRPAQRARLLSLRALGRGIEERPADALLDADAALALDENEDVARSWRIYANDELGNLGVAEADCERLLRAPTATAKHFSICATVARKQNDHIVERSRLERALTIEPTNLSSLVARAGLNEQEGRLAEALADYDAVLRLAPTGPWWNNRAWVKVELGDFAGARPAPSAP